MQVSRYSDDIRVLIVRVSKTREEHLVHVRMVLGTLPVRHHTLRPGVRMPVKFGRASVGFQVLGHVRVVSRAEPGR